MTCVGTHLGPFGSGRIAIGPFDHVKDLLTVSRHIRHRDTTLLTAVTVLVGSGVLTGYARSQHGKRLGTDILTELEVLVEAQPACLMVSPNILRGLSVLPRAYTLVPVIDVVKSLSMAHASPGETHKLWMKGCDGLCQVFAEPMSLEGVVGKEAHHVYGDAVVFQRGQHEPDLTLQGFLVNDQRQSVALPALSLDFHLLFCKHLALVVDQTHQQLVLASIVATDKNGEVKLPERLSHHSAPPRIIECVLLGQKYIVRIVFAQGLHRADTNRMIALPCRRSIPTTMIVGSILEIAVLDKFSIEASIGSITDVLKENTHQPVTDRLLL